MTTSLHQLSLRTAVDRLRTGELSAERYAEALLARVAGREPAVRAFAWLDRERTLEQARRCDRARVAAGEGTLRPRGGARQSGAQDAGSPHLGLLHGVPVGVKDIIDTAGIPTRLGSPVFEQRVPDRSATLVTRIDDAGGYVFGKTVTAELAYYHPGPTTNPWNPAHTPGGSSMGSAAAVAAGMVPMAIGTQTNGSVIRPAAFCGCVGFKPSAGLISRVGVQPFSPTLDQVGVFTRSVEDAALACAALVGNDPRDPISHSNPVLPEDLVAPRALFQPPRLAVVRSPVWRLAEPVQQQAFERALERLAGEGARVEPVEPDPGFDEAHAAHRVLMYYEGARSLSALQQQHRAQLSEPLNNLIDEGLEIEEARYQEAKALRTRLIDEAARLWRGHDAVVTLPARGEAPATLDHTGDPAFCTIWSLLGWPAITLPFSQGAHGLPLGLQLVGGFLEDARLLSVALWCARSLGAIGRIAG